MPRGFLVAQYNTIGANEVSKLVCFFEVIWLPVLPVFSAWFALGFATVADFAVRVLGKMREVVFRAGRRVCMSFLPRFLVGLRLSRFHH